MSAETLRRAAALMRERAEAAIHDCADPLRPDGGPWVARPHHARRNSTTVQTEGEKYLAHYVPERTAAHIASWHPAVALAVAKAMDDVARAWEIADGWALDPDDDPIRFEDTVDGGWVTVARAYLGEAS